MRRLLFFVLTFLLTVIPVYGDTLEVSDVPFMLPENMRGHQDYEGLVVAVVPIATSEHSNRIFGFDMKEAGVLPVQVVMHNTGTKSFVITARQFFGITYEGTYHSALSAGAVGYRIKDVSVGSNVATQATVQGFWGAALGAGVGAGVGLLTGDLGSGAATGAIIGGGAGVLSGVGDGLSDDWTEKYKQQLAGQTLGNSDLHPGDIRSGFIYLPSKGYCKLRVKLFNVTANRMKEMFFPLYTPE